MSLKDSLKSFAAASPYIPPLPQAPATVAAGNRIMVIGGATLRPPEDLDLTSERISDSLQKEKALDLRDLRRAPWCIWASFNPLCVKQHLVECLLGQIVNAGLRKVYRMLAAAWLYHFKPNGLCISLIGDFLSRHAGELGDPWSETHRNFCIFDPAAGPDRIIDVALRAGLSPDDILGKSGFRDTSPATGYREHLYRFGFERFERENNSDPMGRLERIRTWTYREGRVRFEGLRTAAVRAALDPFDDEMPDKDTRDAFLNLVLDLLRDPRSNPGRWTDCAKSEKITRRWLTEQSVRLFFDVVGRAAQQDHWSYRRAFWNALYRQHYIEDAWVVFEDEGAATARGLFGRNLGFGCFDNGAGFQPGHAVLLLRIRGLTVAEWSHNSPCSIWDETDGESGPKLYKGLYSVSELRKRHKGDNSGQNMTGQGVFWHRGSDPYRWQGFIAEYLRKRRGIILSSSDYKVH